MRSYRRLLMAVLALSTSVVAGTNASIPPVRMPDIYETPRPGPALAPTALDRWWLLFGDINLNALEDEALVNASDARTAAARILEARATRSGQKAKTMPTGSISGNVSREKVYELYGPGNDLNPTSGITDAVSGNFNISWEVDLFGRLAVARRVANADAAQARFNVEGTRASLAAGVADAYFQAVGLTIQAQDARETLRIQNDLMNVARRKSAAGAGPPDDVDRVAGEAGRVEAQLIDLESKLAASRRLLLILVGRNLDALKDPPLARMPPESPSAPVVLPADLLSRRPDVREAEFRLRSELGVARLAHLAVFPTITLLPGLGLSSTARPSVSYIPPSALISTQQTTTSGFWSLAAGITAPTLDIPRLLQQASSRGRAIPPSRHRVRKDGANGLRIGP